MELDLALEVIESKDLTPFEVCQLLDHRRIVRALNAFSWNQSAAADYLKIHRNTLFRRMGELNIIRPEPVKRRVGRPLSLAGEMGKAYGLTTQQAKRNGLDREVSALVANIRTKQRERAGAYRAAAQRVKKKRAQAETEKVDQMYALMGIIEREKRRA